MRTLRLLLFILFVLLVAASLWIWWMRPQQADMTAYVPADSLIYVEANDLPRIATEIAATDAWQALAPPAGINFDARRFNLFSTLMRWTGIGPAEGVVLSRGQIALAVLGVGATAGEDDLRVKPRFALIVETHVGENRVRAATDKLVGDIARRAYDAPVKETREADGVFWTTWRAMTGTRQIVAAVTESVAIIGNDTRAVEACLAVRRGERQSLAGNADLEEMRRRVGAAEPSSALAFGYITPDNAPKLLEAVATIYAAQLNLKPSVQSAAATLLPQITNKFIGGAAWSTRTNEGRIEDRYFIRLQNNIAARLAAPLAAADKFALDDSVFAPLDTMQLTRYNYRDPAAAWRGLNAVLSSQLEILSASLIDVFLNQALQPYGIEAPREFFSAIESGVTIARLRPNGAETDDVGTRADGDDEDATEPASGTVLIVHVRDRERLMREVRKRLGAGAKSVAVGDATMLVAADKENGAASFVGNLLIMGNAESVRRCLSAHGSEQTLATNTTFAEPARRVTSQPAPPDAATFTNEQESADTSIRSVAKLTGSLDRFDTKAFARAIARQPYASVESRLAADGIERVTRSAFGLFGVLAAQLDADATPRRAGAQ